MRRTRARSAPRAAAALLAGLLLAGCGGGGYEPAGPFRPLPEGPPPQVGPPTATLPPPADPAQPGSGEEQGDPNVVASGLSVPTGLVLLPDGSAVVGERDTGRLLQVFPDRSPAVELMTVPGLDTSGDGGLLGLALSPTFLEDGLLFAYITTATDNRVVRFPIGGTPNPVLTGIPRGETGNGGALMTGADGHLYVGTGDTGDPALAADPESLAGKVLRIDVFGRAVQSLSPVYSWGYRDVTALCQDGERLYATDEAREGPDEVDIVQEDGPGVALLTVPAEEGGLGGCAVANGTVFLGALDGQRVHVITLDQNGVPVDGAVDEVLGGRYGRLRTVVLDAEGALWVTTSNHDGFGSPAEDDDKVLRIRPPGGQPNSPL
ncbi:Glucose/arabinose dehydrogenase, beta-propeller fold [Blastococcus sp. DSM 46786]|uniref:PQQ-dependent sugar dehydrogenase n=1 Tax=Blastococcus sp. DSM 46786 TaxID=1798227 RepID=UPI0008B51221|nr:PQQ-dependent sugar dehydrogenase [Blastococcus sp. DSM 46786]SEL78229.1 Glucose/arabinose dehydrogenase, beta-propeller fold [Blastococcus sp. DSM 46786]